MENNELNDKILEHLRGAWKDDAEGYRVEIEDDRFLLLHYNKPKLDCGFSLSEAAENGRKYQAVLETEKTELWNKGDFRPFGDLLSVEVSGDRMLMTLHFPMSGNYYIELVKTGETRFGNVSFADEKIHELAGDWLEESNRGLGIRIEGNNLSILRGNESEEVGAVRTVIKPDGRLMIVSEDPSVYEVGFFTEVWYDNEKIHARYSLFNLPEMVYDFYKREK